MNYKITNETPYMDPNSYGTGSIVTPREGYNLRTRGDHNHLVRHDYRCPVHGVFEKLVTSGDVPDVVPCLERVDRDWSTGGFITCDLGARWQYPTVNQGISAGSVKS